MAGTEYIYHRTVVGYHGCDRQTVERVLLEHGSLAPSNNRYDWLGAGIYFWEHGPRRALEFAEWKQRRGEITEPAVLGAYIHLGRCFDLTDTWVTRQLHSHYTRLHTLFEKHGRTLPKNRPAGPRKSDLVLRELDCAVVNFSLDTLKAEGKVFQTVRGIFVEGDPAYRGAKVHVASHIQIAVRDRSCILGYFLPGWR
jgi:hypothetical protein